MRMKRRQAVRFFDGLRRLLGPRGYFEFQLDIGLSDLESRYSDGSATQEMPT